ncbi:MAG: Dyp-type peroxidase [Myxococcales bacterium]|nr:Dyp-type peroxidase [Myxococcales bacterium]
MTAALDLDDVQGLVVSGFRDMSHAVYVLVGLGDDPVRATAWLRAVTPRVSPGRREGRHPDERLQLGLTATGLTALGAPQVTIDGLPQELVDGMPARARVLGDPVDDAGRPVGWTLCAPDRRIDALLVLYGRDPAARARLLDEQLAALDGWAEVVAVEHSAGRGDVEPFGFADGLSQPFVEGQLGAPRPGQDTIRNGEIVLGYPNQYGRLPEAPRLPGAGLPDDDLGRNGTYLVFRKLEQDVPGFWRYFRDQARRVAGRDDLATTEWLAARAMGRWRSGASLMQSPDADDPSWATPERRNAFRYLDDDPLGMRCPIASHVRRANPRDARGGTAAESLQVVNRHRILRRGRAYGDAYSLEDLFADRPAGGDRGLLFVAVSASIARGFEFIQQTWLANPGFHGLQQEPDPVVGGGGDDDDRYLTIPQHPVRLRLAGVPRFVRPRGGAYFFVPGLAALRALGGPAPR